ncbi:MULTISPECIES: hypothetical protein [unclassified Bacteroides]|uniref:hypothetical protein n=1 Tax=unclassified Bacteroides TaxID=2646097 RepID=UPI0004E10496|nr:MULTISPECIES: hypothetical protein [unclassified Bacteroides]
MNPFYKTKIGTPIVRPRQFHVHANVSDEILIETMVFHEKLIDTAFEEKHEVVITYDCGYPIGYSLCVECPIGTPHIYYKVREPRQYQSRMIRGAIPKETSLLTMVLKFQKNNMVLVTAWAGSPAPPELGNISYFEQTVSPMDAVSKSAEFWLAHALIEENPSVEDLIIDLRIIADRLDLEYSTLTTYQIHMILASRLGTDINRLTQHPLYNDVLKEYKDSNDVVH